MDPEKELTSPEEEAAVKATTDPPLLMTLAGVFHRRYSAQRVQCSSRGRCFGARRETVRDKMTRLALTANGSITYYGREGRGVKTLGRPARNSYRLLRYRCAKVLPAEIDGHGIFQK